MKRKTIALRVVRIASWCVLVLGLLAALAAWYWRLDTRSLDVGTEAIQRNGSSAQVTVRGLSVGLRHGIVFTDLQMVIEDVDALPNSAGIAPPQGKTGRTFLGWDGLNQSFVAKAESIFKSMASDQTHWRYVAASQDRTWLGLGPRRWQPDCFDATTGRLQCSAALTFWFIPFGWLLATAILLSLPALVQITTALVRLTIRIALWIAAIRWQTRAKRRPLQGLCPCCGYDLRASKERCPECGTCVSAGDPNHIFRLS